MKPEVGKKWRNSALASGSVGRRPSRELSARGKRRKKRFMEEALVLFGKKGYHATTVEEIAKAVRTGKGTFYWYWPSKEALFHELVLQKFDSYSQALESVTSMDLTVPEKLLLLVNGVSVLYGRYRQLCKLIYSMVSDGSDSLHREVNRAAREYYGYFKQTLLDMVRKGQQEGAIDGTVDSESLVTILISVFDGVMIQESIMEESFATERLGQTLLQVLKGGIFV